ncbi:hypothetical protein L1887_47034 [Cichorium endivia]|nr:hypothetical protein L1887_47034 [Cichorium endivia]
MARELGFKRQLGKRCTAGTGPQVVTEPHLGCRDCMCGSGKRRNRGLVVYIVPHSANVDSSCITTCTPSGLQNAADHQSRRTTILLTSPCQCVPSANTYFLCACMLRCTKSCACKCGTWTASNHPRRCTGSILSSSSQLSSSIAKLAQQLISSPTALVVLSRPGSNCLRICTCFSPPPHTRHQ